MSLKRGQKVSSRTDRGMTLYMDSVLSYGFFRYTEVNGEMESPISI